MPEICPVLAIGLYWLVYGVDSSANQVFPGNEQHDRFRKALRRVLESASMANELERCGTDCDDIGTHSMRKDFKEDVNKWRLPNELAFANYRNVLPLWVLRA
ncbi:hypothetical protein PC120_g7844 [Phytophthora cactorum]|nr:hypothetical protein PC120_g7844 [Phytophthora cactorum]